MEETRFLGDYSIVKQIGQGSLGSVLLAEHRYMKRQFVLKVLPEELATDRTFINRFEEDVALLSALEHPNIVKIHNVSFSQGQYFLVTDCVVDELGETTNLAQYLLSHRKRLDESELLHILTQIAEALDYAHNKKGASKGIAHRGLKLNNILIGQEKDLRNVYLSDFGLSKIIGSGAVLTRSYKAMAEILGISQAVTPQKSTQDRYLNPAIEPQKLSPLHNSFLQNFAFLAPEQKRMDPNIPVDVKADFYAFGVLVYYMIMNEFPEGIFEMPSKRATEYKGDWDFLISHCLQVDPRKRPESLAFILKDVFKSNNEVTSSLNIAKRATIAEGSVLNNLEENTSKETSSLPNLRPILRDPKLERPEMDPDPASIFKIDSTVKQYTPERKEVKNVQPLLTEMVIIHEGAFWRGSDGGNRDEMPRHQITLNSYAIDTHPVTNEQFVRFLEVMGGEKDSNHNDIIRLRESRIKRSGGKITIESGYAKHPVVGVTWYGAVSYARWVGKRLPTEAEWEVATRGGIEGALYFTGDDIEKTQANFFSSDTTAVMSYAPNEYGLYDVAGNVYEWCQDWYGYNYYEISQQEPDNPKGPLQGVYRVLRGGCWKSLKEDLRCSRRHRNNPGTVNGTYGFRCAADVQ